MFGVGVALMGPSVVFGTWGGYWEAKTLGADPRFVDAGMVFVEAGVFALVATHDPRRRVRTGVAWGLAILMAALIIENGNRSALIGGAVGLGWCYSQRVRRVPIVPVVGLALAALLLLPVIKEWRTERRIEASVRSGPGELAGLVLRETGQSALAFAYTLDFVPEPKGYSYGLTYLAAGVATIPNLSPTPGTWLRLVPAEKLPSHWLTSTLHPEWYREGGGLGYAMGAECYFNFGMPGVLIGMALLGYLTTRLRNAAPRSALRLVASALFFAAMCIYVRNELSYPLRIVVWPTAGLWLIRAAWSRVAGPRVAAAGRPPHGYAAVD
jgi:hypothetical protein